MMALEAEAAAQAGLSRDGVGGTVTSVKQECISNNNDLQIGVQVLVSDPREHENICRREYGITKERIEKVLKDGANLVFSTKEID